MTYDEIVAARKVRLDRDRVEDAKRRAAAALEVARHHQAQADAARSTAALLARTWGFDVDEVEAGR